MKINDLLHNILAPAAFTVTSQRSQVMSFGQPITQIYHSFFIKNPTGSLNYTAFIDPFYWTTWIFLLIFIAITPPMLYASARLVSRTLSVLFFFFKSLFRLTVCFTDLGKLNLPIKVQILSSSQ